MRSLSASDGCVVSRVLAWLQEKASICSVGANDAYSARSLTAMVRRSKPASSSSKKKDCLLSCRWQFRKSSCSSDRFCVDAWVQCAHRSVWSSGWSRSSALIWKKEQSFRTSNHRDRSTHTERASKMLTFPFSPLFLLPDLSCLLFPHRLAILTGGLKLRNRVY